nr:MAG TPA: hypothetical protein [Caudoviricetes sp.]
MLANRSLVSQMLELITAHEGDTRALCVGASSPNT